MVKRLSQKRDAAATVKAHVRRDDIVSVIAGRDKGKKGKVLRVLPDKGVAFVEGINTLVKAIRPDPQVQQSGGFVRREGAIALSNLQLYCSNCDKPARVSRRISGDRKERICKKCGNPIGKA